VRFFKLSGAGNDFVAFDNREDSLPPEAERPPWFRRLCARGEGVGADGVLLLVRSDTADVRMRYHNADGGEAEMCGNGLRCLARLAHHLGAAGREMTVQTAAGLHRAVIVDDERVRVTLTDPRDIREDVELSLGGHVHRATLVNPGVPHAVVEIGDGPEGLANLNVQHLGQRLRHHPVVMPAGANVDFFCRDTRGDIHLRTYERGVEAETLACGTGAAATAIALALAEGRDSPVPILTRGGHTLAIHFRRGGDEFSDVVLEGPAVITFQAELAPALMARMPVVDA
jgi:diaminopimelate epimerase